MLSLPIYLLGSSYYLPTRIKGKQVKRSLRTSYRRVAIIRAITLMDSLTRDDFPPKYELDASKGIFKADGPEDHARLRQAIEAMKALHAGQLTPTMPAPALVIAYPIEDHLIATTPEQKRHSLALILRAARQEMRRPAKVSKMGKALSDEVHQYAYPAHPAQVRQTPRKASGQPMGREHSRIHQAHAQKSDSYR